MSETNATPDDSRQLHIEGSEQVILGRCAGTVSRKPTDAHVPTIACPGCGVPVAWLSNCGRYQCVSVYGFPIVLDPVHRSTISDTAQRQRQGDKTDANQGSERATAGRTDRD